MYYPLTLCRDETLIKRNMDHTHEDQDGMAETKSAIILIHIQDEMMPIQAKMQRRSPAQ